MGLILFGLLVALPLFELWLLIEVGSQIGGIEVIALSLLTAAVGLALVRRQGLATLAKLSANPGNTGETGRALVHGVFLLLAGLCLIIPGFFTDSVGALLLIPPVRIMLGGLGLAHWAAANSPYRQRYSQQGETRSEYHRHQEWRDGMIVETEVIASWEDEAPDASGQNPGLNPNATGDQKPRA